MPESDSQVEYSGSAYVASKFFGLCAEREVDVGDLAGQDLERIFVSTRCQVEGTLDHRRYLSCKHVLADEKERIDIRTYAIIYQYAKEAAYKFLGGMWGLPKSKVQQLLSGDDNLWRFLDVIKDEMAKISEGSEATRILLSKIIGILSRYSISQSETLLGSLRIICEEAWGDSLAEIRVSEECHKIKTAALAKVAGEVVPLRVARDDESGQGRKGVDEQ